MLPKLGCNWFGPVLIVFMIMVGAGWLSGPAAQSMARTVASLKGDVARRANTGTNLIIAVTEAAVALGRTSASVAAEAWSGVDLVDSVVSIQWCQYREQGG